MRIAYFTDTYLPQVNGVTNTLDKLKNYLAKNGTEYMFFAPEYHEKTITIREGDVKRFKSIPFPPYPECRLSLPIYANLARLTDSFKPDLVHLVTPLGIGLAGLKYARERGIPFVSSFHTNFDMYLKYYNLEYFHDALWNYFKWFHSFCALNFCPSQDTLETLSSKGIDKLRIWSRGIDTEKFNPIYRDESLRQKLGAGERKLFLYVGRLAAEKDLDILMKSIVKINELYPGKAMFVLAGDGPNAGSLKASAPENVVFPGYLRGRELSAMYASCDAFVFPSSTETFGNVVLEAMASGLPVVTVNSGGVKDSMLDNYNGLLCKPRDVESFTLAIERLLTDSGLIIELGRNAREYALTKSWNWVFDNLISDYKHILYNYEHTKQQNRLA